MENSQKPAFANMPSHTDPKHTIGEYGGLTKREYTCIKLGIPETGDPELDELIRKSERKRLISLNVHGLLSAAITYGGKFSTSKLVNDAVFHYDELLKQLSNE